ATRALALARATGQGELFLVLYQILGRTWYVRGQLAEAAELLDGAIEAARLLGQTQALAGNLFNRSVVAVATGDLDTAMTTAQESVDPPRHRHDHRTGKRRPCARSRRRLRPGLGGRKTRRGPS